MLENLVGFFKVMGIYIISSFGGGLFSSLISDKSAVGASVALFGMLGAYVNITII
jgi:membrane associated rhomboid family serine protease